MKLVIATLLYRKNSLEYLPFFLNSLESATDDLNFDYKILFGDNSGADLANQRFIEEQKIINREKINYLHFGNNLGFAKAYNKLINQAFSFKAELFLALNPDVLCSKDSIKNLVEAMDKNKTLSSLAPKILVWDFKNKRLKNQIDSCGLILKPGLVFKDLRQGENDKNEYKINHQIIGPSGAVALYKLSALERIKEKGQYFDENFFMYKEDCDLAYRFYLEKLPSKTVINSIFYHDRSVSGGSLLQRLKSRLKRSKQQRVWSFQGQVYIYKKHFKSLSILNKLFTIINWLRLYLFSAIFEPFVFKKELK
jgi:GT2 family glycosyltransferase